MKRLGAIAGIVLAAVLVSTVSGFSYLWQWRGSPPIKIVLVNVSVTDQYLVQGVAQAATSWGASSTFDITIGTKGTKKVSLYQGFYGTSFPMATTVADSKSGRGYIGSAAIYFNLSLMGSLDSLGQPGQYKRAIVCHEVGHALGLDHVENPSQPTCMTDGTDGYEFPSAQDFVNLEALYGG